MVDKHERALREPVLRCKPPAQTQRALSNAATAPAAPLERAEYRSEDLKSSSEFTSAAYQAFTHRFGSRVRLAEERIAFGRVRSALLSIVPAGRP